MPGKAYELLFEIATSQYGYVTQDQALDAGLSKNALAQLARRGDVERVAHGLYRFNAVPRGALDTYMEAVLWPRGATAVLSHETALELYDLSDVNPAKVHLTLPPGHRISRVVPHQYKLHFAALEPDEVTYREGLPVTTVERTILDCQAAHLRPSLIEQAIAQARARGLINQVTADALLRDRLIHASS